MIKLFSEEVNPTFTNSVHNILTVESYEEVFFDVFEFEINGTKYIAEKDSTFKGSPVISIPVVEDGVSKSISFILTEGDRFEVLYNKDVASCIEGNVVEESVIEEELHSLQPLIEEEEAIIDIEGQYKEDIFEEIENTRKLAGEYAERIKLQKIEEANDTIEEKQLAIKQFLDIAKDDLLDEFNSALINSRSDQEVHNEQQYSQLEKYLTARIESNFNVFFENNNERIKELTASLSDRVNQITDKLVEEKINPALYDIIGSSKDKLFSITEDINNTLSETEQRVVEQVKLELSESKSYIDSLENTITSQNVELNDLIKKGVDKALGRVGNIKTSVLQLEKEIKDKVTTTSRDVTLLEERVLEELQSIDSNIRSYYDDKIDKVSNQMEELTTEQRHYFTNVIEESKDKLLNQIDTNTNSTIIAESLNPQKGTKAFNKSVKKLKTELQQDISERFTNEISSLKRLIEMSSGGGSVATQFALGGTMDGSLQVNGVISSNCGNSDEWCSTHSTVQSLSNQWDGGDGLIYDDSWLYPLTGNWESTYTTVSANSASWGSAGAGDFCNTTVLLNEVSACGGTMSVDGLLSASNMVTTALTADIIHFNTDPETSVAGNLSWNVDESTLDLSLDNNVVLQVGEEQVINVKASEAILNGQVVYASGAVGGGSGKIEVSLYSASSAEGVVPGAADELFFVGVATQDFAQNGFGYITTFGKVRDVVVEHGQSIVTDIVGVENIDKPGFEDEDPDWEQGTVLYISTEAGKLTNNPPLSPNKIIPTAMVIGVEGNKRTLFIRQEHGYHIDELHDVRITNPQEGDILVFNAALSSWDNTDYKEIIHDYLVPQTLIDQATVTYDASSGINALLTLTADRTLSTITNAPSGSSGTLTVIQDAVGGHLLTLDAGYNTAAGDVAATVDMGPNELAQLSWFTHDSVNFYIWSTV